MNSPSEISHRVESTAGNDVINVVRGGYCVGCGACAAEAPAQISMQFDRAARYIPQITTPKLPDRASAACPFADGPDEDALSAHFADVPDARHDTRLGWHAGLYVGHAADQHRAAGSSGGLASWLLSELIRQRLVDGVIHVRPCTEPGRPRFLYTISTSMEMVTQNAKTRYYPVEMSDVLAQVRATPGRYVFMGVPCYVKAVRRMALQDPVLRERIVFAFSVFCGHMKSGRFSESLAWQMGVKAQDWSTVDFRRKLEGRPASAYGFAVRKNSGEELVRPMRNLKGYDWGMGVFRLSACDYCDDIVGETADASFGDAWLPAYVGDSAGTSLVIARHPTITALLQQARAAGRVVLDDCSVEDMVKSQEASFRHRRVGLAFRLWLKDQARQWRPRKRVAPDTSQVPPGYHRVFRFRMVMSASSHVAFHIARATRQIGVYTMYARVIGQVNRMLLKRTRTQQVSGKP